MLSNSQKITELIKASFLTGRMKLNYLQTYQTRINKLTRE